MSGKIGMAAAELLHTTPIPTQDEVDDMLWEDIKGVVAKWHQPKGLNEFYYQLAKIIRG